MKRCQMKKTLAYKSISEIIFTLVILFITVVVAVSFLTYYQFNYEIIPDTIKILVIVAIIVAVVSIAQFILLIRNPRIMMEHDEQRIYYYHRRKPAKVIRFDEIQNIVARTSIWTKPFVVYVAIVLETEKETIYFRHIAKMKEVKDYIQHIAYDEGIR